MDIPQAYAERLGEEEKKENSMVKPNYDIKCGKIMCDRQKLKDLVMLDVVKEAITFATTIWL